MSANIWNSIAGYVIINIKGPYLERLLNRMLQKNIEVWDVSRCGGTLRLSVSIAGFYRLRAIVRDYPCRVRIVEKHGLTVALCHMRNRYVMMFGWLAVIAALLIASRFVWFVDIEGCDAVREETLEQTLARMGATSGVRRGSLDTAEIARQVMRSDPRIAWAGAELTGVVLQVSIIEAGDGINVHTPGSPCSIYAANDGVITSITALSGKPMVKAGDAVKAGDVLISGELGNEVYAEARGSVEAEVLYRLEYTADWTQKTLVNSGRSEKNVWVELNDTTVIPGVEPFANYRAGKKTKTVLPSILPLAICEEVHEELVEKTGRADEATVSDFARKGAEALLNAKLPAEAAIISKQTLTAANERGVTCVINAVAEQNIARTGDLTTE